MPKEVYVSWATARWPLISESLDSMGHIWRANQAGYASKQASLAIVVRTQYGHCSKLLLLGALRERVSFQLRASIYIATATERMPRLACHDKAPLHPWCFLL